jgi:hypothetical protein
MIAMEMILQPTSGNITYHDAIKVCDKEPNISLERSAAVGGCDSFSD